MAHGCDTHRPLAYCRIALSGWFGSLTHEELREVVEDLGGEIDPFPQRHTKYLLVGEGQLPLDEQARPTRAIEKARQLQGLGYRIEILSEQQFWNRCGLDSRQELVRRLYTIGQLSRILNVKRDLLRSWVRAGLIRPTEIVHRLAFFDFGQVQSAKTLCDLAKCGVSTARMRASLESLRRWLPELNHALEQLALLEDSGRLLIRYGDVGLAEAHGQLRLDFELEESTQTICWAEHESADELFEHGLEFQDAGKYGAAADCYRRAIELDPHDPVLHFNLGTVLYEGDQLEESAAAYHRATLLDSQYAEAWNGLGCVLSKQERTMEAVAAFRRAVQIVPDFGDAHFNLASELEERREFSVARQHWQRYLELDKTSSWADEARARLAEHDRNQLARLSS